MRIERLARAASFRQAALQTTAFLALFLIASAAAVDGIRRIESRAAHAEIAQTEDDMTDLLRARGEAALVARLDAPQRDPSRVFRLEDPAGRRLAGSLPRLAVPAGAARAWMETGLAGGWGGRRILAYYRREPDGLKLTVGEDLSVGARRENAVIGVVVGLAAVLAALGLILAAFSSRRMLRRVDAMANVVDAYAAGDRSSRNPVATRGRDELDELADALNGMMTREDGLVEGLRQVSSSLAHDLRRPLVRHNQAIAEVLAGPATAAEYREALVAASRSAGEVLETFQALLHIAELEAGAPGLELSPVDLAAVAVNVVDAYAALAEEGGRRLTLEAPVEAAVVFGEPRVLGRMLANLVENGLLHTPVGSHVRVAVHAEGPRVSVSDDGPGVPPEARSRLMERFYRVDASRSTPGSGLGLALAAAACRAFGGELSIHDASPGLRVEAEFGAGASRPRDRGRRDEVRRPAQGGGRLSGAQFDAGQTGSATSRF